MRKNISVQGPNGFFEGYVDVIMNYGSEIRPYYNPSTHEQENRKAMYHIISGGTMKTTFDDIKEFNESKVVEIADQMEKRVLHLLEGVANIKNVPTVEEELREKGYD